MVLETAILEVGPQKGQLKVLKTKLTQRGAIGLESTQIRWFL
jgi:hypothetical protein